MEGIALVLVLSLAMFIGCYLAGIVPLAINFSESKLRLITVFGAGLLVGTALAVIIPEGVGSIYEAQGGVHQRSHANEAHVSEHHLDHNEEALINEVGNSPPKNLPHPVLDNKIEKGLDENKREKREATVEQPKERASLPWREKVTQPPSIDVHAMIGIALVAGFVFMLVVDQISRGSGRDMDKPRYKMTATIGLVVHAAADGIALGAASTTKHNDIQFIVFIAIMLHKAPAAFGLVTFLLHEGLEKARVKRHLFIFASAAPVLAIFTFTAIKQGGSESLSSLSSTGMLMLFSAGTFLYVATVHVLPEIVNQGSNNGSQELITPTSGGHSHSHGGGFKCNELVALISGAILPCIITLGHSH